MYDMGYDAGVANLQLYPANSPMSRTAQCKLAFVRERVGLLTIDRSLPVSTSE